MALVEYSVSDRIGYITLNRPEKRNALNPELIGDLHAIFLKAEADPQCKVIVLRANGEAFCSGADLAYLQKIQQFTPEENLADSRQLKNLLLCMYRLRKVIIAEVQGPALAGGCGLMTVCDFAITVPEAKFGYTEVRIGFVPAIVMIFLIRKIGEASARGLLLTGRLMKASEALSLGIVHKVVDAASLSVEVESFAKNLVISVSAQSLSQTKQLISDIQDLPLEEALELAAQQNVSARGTEDCKAGIASFLNKQPHTW